MSYKEEHEAFVSNNEGTSVIHIATAVLACVLTVYLRDGISLMQTTTNGQRNWYSFAMDMLLLILPVQLILTILSHYIASIVCLSTVIIIFILLCILNFPDSKSSTPAVEKTTLQSISMGNKRSFITYYRAFVNILTAFSILAVDFKVFPRYFGKTETFGTGLMDMGVGAFLVSNAIVSPEARGITNTDELTSSLLKSIKSSLPLWLLGVARLLAVKSTDYHEHVTEYGVHWNFFFTLAIVKVFCTVLFCSVSHRLWNMASVAIIATYQYGLSYIGLTDYLMNGEDGKGGRVDWFDANREGYFSCAGYLSLYILTVQIGKLLMKKRSSMADWMKLAIHLLIICITSWAMLFCSVKYVQPVSRRFANLSYMLWMLGFNTSILLALLLMEIMLTYVIFLRNKSKMNQSKKTEEKTDTAQDTDDNPYTCNLAYAVNYNGLLYFLLANVLTGLVNLSIKTMYQSTYVSMTILFLYMLVLSIVSVVLYDKKIRIKFW